MREPTKFKKPIKTSAVLSNREKTRLKFLIFPKKHPIKCRSL
ncbi:hypothetical protein [Wolbachia endosymbiont of Madathamugadia hiepei]